MPQTLESVDEVDFQPKFTRHETKKTADGYQRKTISMVREKEGGAKQMISEGTE